MRFDEMSVSELVSACAEMLGIEASRALSREELIDILISEDPQHPPDPLDEVRGKIEAYVDRNREFMLICTLDCDLVCRSCPHPTVIACWTTNKEEIDD
jgi:hypothetical protein